MKNCLLLYGGDAYDLEHSITCHKPEHESEMHRFQAEDVTIKTAEELLFSPSFFAKTFVVIEHAQDLSDKVLAVVRSFVKKPTPSVFLLLHATGKCSLKDEMPTIEIPEVKPWDRQAKIAEWVAGYLKQQGIKAHPEVAAFIAATGSTDRILLSQELDKLITFAGEKKELSLDDVKTVGAFIHEESAWHLSDAFLARDKKRAQILLHQLIQQQVSPFLLLRQLRSSCHQALMMLSFEAAGVQNIQEHFPQLKGKMFDKNMRLAKEAGMPFLRRALLEIDKAERALKDSPLDEVAITMKVLV